MKKKVVAAALICSVLGSSHATENQQFDEYGDNFQNGVQRPVQRLDRFRRHGGNRTPEVTNRFTNRGDMDSNYVINDQTGQKMYLHEITNASDNRDSSRLSEEERQYSRRQEMYPSSGGHQGGSRISNLSHSGRMSEQQDGETEFAHYDFTGGADDRQSAGQWRDQDRTQGRFAAAESHRSKLERVHSSNSVTSDSSQMRSAQFEQYPQRSASWSNTASDEQKPRLNSEREANQSWNSPHGGTQQSWNSPHGGTQHSWNSPHRGTQHSWNSPQRGDIQSSNNLQADRTQSWSQAANNVDVAENSVTENYASDNKGFWPSRAQQTRYSQSETESFHNRPDELSTNGRRIYSRMENPDSRSNREVAHDSFSDTDQSVSQGRPAVNYQSLRRPSVRVDLSKKQSDRTSRQRRSWFPNPLKGVSRMFSGIFGRR